jgi:hypothetical protein
MPNKDYSADLMRALVAKLYSTITGNDNNNVKIPRNKFVSWMLPGIPFQPQDFLYCSKGLIGESAEQTKELYHQAFVLSKLLDYVPDVNDQFIDRGLQQTIWNTTQDSISSVYNDVLKYSKVVDIPLSDAEKAKIQRYRDALTVTKEVTDFLTDEKKTVSEPGPLTLAYTAKMNDYIDAADTYMDLLVDAQSAKGNDAEAIRRVAEFANKSKFLRSKMEAAYMAWTSQGYKNEYEQINAYIAQASEKSMVMYKEDLKNKFKAGLLTSPLDGGSDFYYTTLLPGNFASSPGWTRFTYYEGDFESNYSKETSQWGGSAGVNFGLFSIGASASGSKIEVNKDAKASNFRASFSFTQIPICRSWFDPGFFSMKGWTLDNLWDLNFDKKISDGASKPNGRLVAYPVTALFVKDVNFTFDTNSNSSQYIGSQISAGGSFGWGPFTVGGSYSHGKVTSNFKSDYAGGQLTIPGMQLIGFVNNIIPKSPDPNPNIKPDQFVGSA